MVIPKALEECENQPQKQQWSLVRHIIPAQTGNPSVRDCCRPAAVYSCRQCQLDVFIPEVFICCSFVFFSFYFSLLHQVYCLANCYSGTRNKKLSFKLQNKQMITMVGIFLGSGYQIQVLIVLGKYFPH